LRTDYARDSRILGVVVVDYYVAESISKRAIQYPSPMNNKIFDVSKSAGQK